MSEEGETGPAFRVVRGNPSDEELAALTVVLLARWRAAEVSAPAPVRSGWSAYGRTLRSPGPPSPYAWRMSAAPR